MLLVLEIKNERKDVLIVAVMILLLSCFTNTYWWGLVSIGNKIEKERRQECDFYCVMTRQPCVLPCVSGVSPGRSFLYVHQAGQRADGSPLIQLTGTAGYATVTLNPLK